jgi:hypothetical protein
VDRLFRRRHAPLVAGLAAQLAYCFAVAWLGVSAGLGIATSVSRLASLPIQGIGLILSVIVGFDVFTWRRLWRCGRDERERLIYDRGVRGVGVAIWAVMTFLLTPLLFVPGLPGAHHGPKAYLASAMGIGVVSWSGFLWVGYLWGVVAAQLCNVAGEAKRKDLPPPP